MRFLQGLVFSLWLIFEIQQTQVICQTLNMGVTAFDDQYEGCEDEMEQIVFGSLLTKEKEADDSFKHAWEKAENKWGTCKPVGSRKEYGIALMAYTAETDLYKNFNTAIREFKDKTSFRYHSLHFLITQALKLLKPIGAKTELYRGMRRIRLETQKGEKVRFGQFASTSESKDRAMLFGDDTFITLNSSFGANISSYSFNTKEKEVLIPVDEVFEVTGYEDVEGKVTINLTATETRCHNYNCDYLEGEMMAQLAPSHVLSERPVPLSCSFVPCSSSGPRGLLHQSGKMSNKYLNSGGTRQFLSWAAVAFVLTQIIMFG